VSRGYAGQGIECGVINLGIDYTGASDGMPSPDKDGVRWSGLADGRYSSITETDVDQVCMIVTDDGTAFPSWTTPATVRLTGMGYRPLAPTPPRDPAATCPAPPRPVKEGFAPRHQGQLLRVIPSAVPGFRGQAPQSVTPGDVDHGERLPANGFVAGYIQIYENATSHIDIRALQFHTPDGAFRYEMAEKSDYCGTVFREAPPGGVAGAVGVSTPSQRGVTTRVSFIRGAIDYVLYFDGPDFPTRFRAEVTRAVASMAAAAPAPK
jgi:hypothetical protein